MSHEPRLWQHDKLWRIQDFSQRTDRNGTTYDIWTSRRDEQGVLFFETEAQAREYLTSGENNEK